jgi:hypothetical protein
MGFARSERACERAFIELCGARSLFEGRSARRDRKSRWPCVSPLSLGESDAMQKHGPDQVRLRRRGDAAQMRKMAHLAGFLRRGTAVLVLDRSADGCGGEDEDERDVKRSDEAGAANVSALSGDRFHAVFGQ